MQRRLIETQYVRPLEIAAAMESHAGALDPRLAGVLEFMTQALLNCSAKIARRFMGWDPGLRACDSGWTVKSQLSISSPQQKTFASETTVGSCGFSEVTERLSRVWRNVTRGCSSTGACKQRVTA